MDHYLRPNPAKRYHADRIAMARPHSTAAARAWHWTRVPELLRSRDSGPLAAYYAHIATLMPDGAPHSVPVWIHLEGDNLVVLTGPGSRKARNLERDPRVAISITDVDQPFASALIRGRVVERVEGDRAWEIIDRISRKYTGQAYAP